LPSFFSFYFRKKTVFMKNLDFQNKKVLVRVDFNVPLDKQYQVTDDTRIRAAVPTIRRILQGGGAVILMSHFGRPLAKLNADGTINREKFTLHHTLGTLSALVGVEAKWCPECVGSEAEAAAQSLRPGEVLLLENTRFHAEEEAGDEAFARRLAALADVYVNDAFGSAHRAHASTTTVARFFTPENKTFGYLMEAEVKNASRVLNNPERPLTAIIGGAKVSDKILLLERLLQLADNIIIGGGMAYTLIKAQGGEIGKSLCESEKLDTARSFLAQAAERGVNVYLPVDSLVADAFSETANTEIQSSSAIGADWMGLDIGPEARKTFAEVVKNSRTLLWNGPMGVFEMAAFAEGTRTVARACAEATQLGAFSLVGGGDSVAAVNQMGLADEVSYVSTGGGAMLEFLEGKTLPGVAAIG
jgi:phosphoglycerate kinase